MRSKALWHVVPSLVLFASPAEAHFHLDQPAASQQQSTTGDPQKPASLTDACPAGSASGLVTQVRAGGTLKIKISETVPHGGHYRVSFANTKSAFQFPESVASGNQCQSTTILPEPIAPVLADGLFVHDQAAANGGKFCNGTATCETEVTIPKVAPGNYVMQVIEWMVPHGSAANNGVYGCFYAHCADIQVVDADAGVVDGTVIGDAGASSSGASVPDGGGTPAADGGNGATGSAPRSTGSSADDGGCSVGAANRLSLGVPLLLALVAVQVLRRKRPRA